MTRDPKYLPNNWNAGAPLYVVAGVSYGKEFVYHMGNDVRKAFQYYVAYRQDSIGTIEFRKYIDAKLQGGE